MKALNSRFEVIPKYEGDFVTIIFTPRMAKYLPRLKETDPEAFERFSTAISELEIVMLDSGHVGTKITLTE